MSKQEYDALMAGNVLRNDTNHGALGQKTDLVGAMEYERLNKNKDYGRRTTDSDYY